MDDDARSLIDALKASLQGNLKAAAMTVYGTSEQDAGSRMAKWWNGTLNPPPLAYVLALRGPNPVALLEVIGDLAGYDFVPRQRDPAQLRAEALEALAGLREQLERISADLAEADLEELRGERRGPVRVRREAERERGVT